MAGSLGAARLKLALLTLASPTLLAAGSSFAADTLVQVRTSPEASGYTREQIPNLARRIVASQWEARIGCFEPQSSIGRIGQRSPDDGVLWIRGHFSITVELLVGG